jgi:hypothetical protein
MNAIETRKLVVELEVARCDAASLPECRTCRQVLDLLQPVIGRPESMLGTCPSCGAWHYLADAPGGAGLLIVPLPLSAMAGEPATPVTPATPSSPKASTKRRSTRSLHPA